MAPKVGWSTAAIAQLGDFGFSDQQSSTPKYSIYNQKQQQQQQGVNWLDNFKN